MADNLNHQLNSDDIRDLLSPYLDGEVTEEERVLVEQALVGSTELQRELETLRRTVTLLTALPPMPAPRPFTLTEADVKIAIPARKNFFGLPTWFRGVATLAVVLLCVVAAGSLFWSMQFKRASQPAAEVANAPKMTAATVAPEAQSAAAPVQPTATEEPAPAGAAAREAPAPAASATEEAMMAAEAAPTQVPPAATPVIALAVPSTDEAAKQVTHPPAAPIPATAGQAITSSQADQSNNTQQSLAVQPPAASDVAATPSPAPTVMTFAAPAQEPEAAESTETEQMAAAESGAAPTQPAPQEKAAAGAEAQTDQLRTENTPAPTEAPALKQAPPSPTPTSTLTPQPSATPVALLTLSAPPTSTVTSTPSPQNVSGSFWPTISIAIVGLLIIAGVIIWLVRRSRP